MLHIKSSWSRDPSILPHTRDTKAGSVENRGDLGSQPFGVERHEAFRDVFHTKRGLEDAREPFLNFENIRHGGRSISSHVLSRYERARV